MYTCILPKHSHTLHEYWHRLDTKVENVRYMAHMYIASYSKLASYNST